MFSPNLKGQLQKRTGRDKHGRHQLAPAVDCPFGPVNLEIGSIKTTVRADSSASRGSADQIAAERGKILVPPYVKIANNDIFTFQGEKFEVVSVHPRYSVTGRPDHFEVDLRTFLE